MYQKTVYCIALLFLAAQLANAQTASTPPKSEDQKKASFFSKQTPEQIKRSLESFKKVDDHPLFKMHFIGDYVADTPRNVSSIEPNRRDQSWACSLFVAFNKNGKALYGRNFDWQYNPALLLYTNPSNGYAAISMVDISYLGFDRKDDKYKTVEGRQALLQAPLLPFDGMNEHGLTVGMAAVGKTKIPLDKEKPTVGSLQIIRLMLDRAKNVDEAISIFKKYNVKGSGGPLIHYLVADADGKSVLIELKDGKTHFIQGKTNWQSATNFYLTDEDKPLKQCPRFAKISRLMNDEKGNLDIDQSFRLLKNVAQVSTRWSVVYDIKNRQAHVAMSRNFKKRYKFDVEQQKSTTGTAAQPKTTGTR